MSSREKSPPVVEASRTPHNVRELCDYYTHPMPRDMCAEFREDILKARDWEGAARHLFEASLMLQCAVTSASAQEQEADRRQGRLALSLIAGMVSEVLGLYARLVESPLPWFDSGYPDSNGDDEAGEGDRS